MGVRARPDHQVVLAGEAHGLVVVALKEQARVVNLEDVDVGEVLVQRRRVRDGVQPVERVRHVDEAALPADRRDRVCEGEPARDLLLEEESDHLALAVGLHLLAGNDDEVASARELGRFQRASERVVVRNGDCAEPDRLCVHDEIGGIDRAVV